VAENSDVLQILALKSMCWHAIFSEYVVKKQFHVKKFEKQTLQDIKKLSILFFWKY